MTSRRTVSGRLGSEKIANFIESQLLTGQFHNEQQLPTSEVLARRFKVDVNTARAAYRLLQAKGLVRSTRGKGTFATKIVDEAKADYLLSLARDAVAAAADLGLSAEQLSTVIGMHQLREACPDNVFYVDSDYPYIEQTHERIEQLIGRHVIRLSVARLRHKVKTGVGPAAGDLVVTSKYNLDSVADTLKESEARIVAFAHQLSPETITNLSALGSVEPIGIICIEQKFADVTGKVVDKIGVGSKQLRGSTSDVSTLPAIFRNADAILISSVAQKRLDAARVKLPIKPILPFHFELRPDSEEIIVDAYNSLNEVQPAPG